MAQMLAVHQAIAERLDTWLSTRGAKFIDGRLPEGDEIPTIPPDGRVQPHACFWMGEPDEHPDGRALDGAINALGLLSFQILCVAGDPYQLTMLRDIVIRCLVGWVLPDGSEITGNGALGEMPVPTMVRPQRYTRVLGFWASVGASSVVV